MPPLEPQPPTNPPALPRRVLLIGWDGADWQVARPLMERGEMPALHSFCENGVTGDLPTQRPMLSPMLWNSIATGKRPDKHGIHGFFEVDESGSTVRPATSISRTTKAVWNILHQSGKRCNVLNWFAGHPAEPINGVCVSEMAFKLQLKDVETPAILPTGSVHPATLRETVLENLLTYADIDAQTIALFVRHFEEIDSTQDRRLEAVVKQLVECLSIHAVTTWLMANTEWDFTAVYFGTLDHFSHGFMQYHPPRLPWVSEADFRLYGDVVNSAYRLHDLLLKRLLDLAGPETAVILCSDHGFHSGALRRQDRPRIPAAPAEDHRPVGILAMNGPGFREDILLHGATQMDIAPTVLRLLGVPAAQDFDGSPLEDALAETLPPARQPIRSWDMVPGNAGQHDEASSRLDANASQALLDQLAAIGYIDGGQATDPAYIESCRAETEWNLARVYLYSGRPFKAAPILARLHHRSPLRLDVALGYYECLQKLGLSENAGEVVRTLAAAHEGAPTGDFLAGVGLSMAGRHQEALQRFRKAEAELSEDANLLFYLGQALVRIRALDEGEAVFRRLLDINPDFQHAAYALARLLLRTGRPSEALAEVRRCLSLDFGNARNHFLHGRVLARMDRYEEAIAAVGEALRLEPANVRAHLYRRGLLLRTARNDEVAPIEAIQSEMLARRTEALRRRQELVNQLDAIRTQAVAEAAEKGRSTQDILRRLDALLPAADRIWEHLGTPSGKTFVVVSGLPRSGTSLMMQMLETAGLTVKTDGERQPDPDNPRGYLEWELVKSLPRNPLLLDDVVEDAVKIVTPHLPHLPPHHRYLILYMTRPLEEVARSQTRMMERIGTPVPFAQNEQMIEELKQLEESVLRRVQRHPGVRLLPVSFPDLNEDPPPVLRRIVDFLGEKQLPHADRMRAVIRPELYRQRNTKEDTP